MFAIAQTIGYPLIFAFVMMETGCGIPFAPGELAVITGGIAASDGQLSLPVVIGVASVAAMLGDNLGYLIGRAGGRRLLEKPGPFFAQRQRVLGMADPFFERHGGKAVFWGRWLPFLRVYASWLAGGSRMPWRTFLVWNTLGAVAWSISMAMMGYLGGAGAKHLIETLGKYGVILVALVVIGLVVAHRLAHRRRPVLLAAESNA